MLRGLDQSKNFNYHHKFPCCCYLWNMLVCRSLHIYRDDVVNWPRKREAGTSSSDHFSYIRLARVSIKGRNHGDLAKFSLRVLEVTEEGIHRYDIFSYSLSYLYAEWEQVMTERFKYDAGKTESHRNSEISCRWSSVVTKQVTEQDTWRRDKKNILQLPRSRFSTSSRLLTF